MMNVPSSAANFWEAVPSDETEAFDWLSQLARDGSDENEWRDFKAGKLAADGECPPEEQKKNDRKIRSIWSESLGAFANNIGGILIWGIEAPDDKAVGLSLCPDAPRLVKKLENLKNDTVEPPVPGVKIRSICKLGSAEGFVICLIPESDFRPHRAKHADKEYYIRMGASSLNFGTTLLRAMFAERRTCRVVPEVRASIVPADGGKKALSCTVKLKHISGPSARELRVLFRSRSQNGLGPFDCYPNDSEWNGDRWHPKTILDARRTLHCGEDVNLYRNVSCPCRQEFDETEILTFEFTLLALDQSPFLYSCKLPMSEMLKGEVMIAAEMAGTV